MKLLVLELKPINAAVSYDLSELIDDSVPSSFKDENQHEDSDDKDSDPTLVV